MSSSIPTSVLVAIAHSADAKAKAISILKSLKKGSHTSAQIKEQTGIPVPTLSKWLRLMADQGWVERIEMNRTGLWTIKPAGNQFLINCLSQEAK